MSAPALRTRPSALPAHTDPTTRTDSARVEQSATPTPGSTPPSWRRRLIPLLQRALGSGDNTAPDT